MKSASAIALNIGWPLNPRMTSPALQTRRRGGRALFHLLDHGLDAG